ncbi:MAG: hypothetical protein OXF02_05130 [Simkaniaceae bacterium]|nr:hypothetical protein [Simkaniaceae bacterium]
MQLVQLVGIALRQAIRKESDNGGTFAYFPFFVRGSHSGTWWMVSVRGNILGRHMKILQKVEAGTKLFILGEMAPPRKNAVRPEMTVRAFKMKVLDGAGEELPNEEFIFDDDNYESEYKESIQ